MTTIVQMDRLDLVDTIKKARRALEDHEDFYHYDALTEIMASATQADLRLSDDLALEPESETDFVLKPEHYGVWITVGNLSVHVRRTLSGVQVDVYPLGYEDCDAIDSLVTFDEADLQPDLDHTQDQGIDHAEVERKVNHEWSK